MPFFQPEFSINHEKARLHALPSKLFMTDVAERFVKKCDLESRKQNFEAKQFMHDSDESTEYHLVKHDNI